MSPRKCVGDLQKGVRGRMETAAGQATCSGERGVLAKALGGGVPAAAILKTRAIADEALARRFIQASSHQGDPFQCAVALATIEFIEAENLLDTPAPWASGCTTGCPSSSPGTRSPARRGGAHPRPRDRRRRCRGMASGHQGLRRVPPPRADRRRSPPQPRRRQHAGWARAHRRRITCKRHSPYSTPSATLAPRVRRQHRRSRSGIRATTSATKNPLRSHTVTSLERNACDEVHPHRGALAAAVALIGAGCTSDDDDDAEPEETGRRDHPALEKRSLPAAPRRRPTPRRRPPTPGRRRGADR